MQGEGGRRKGDDKKATGKDSRVGGLHYNLGGGSLVDKDLRKLAPNLERESTSVARLPRSGRWEETGSDWQ